MTPLLLCLLLGGTPNADIALTPTEGSIDKGETRGGPPLVQTFEFKHTAGVGPVVITGVEAACGCHRHAISNRVLNPGDKSTLTLEVNTLTQPAGKNTWAVRVKFQHEPPTGNPVPGHVDVTLKATLTHDLTVTPAQLVVSAAGESSPVITITDHRVTGNMTVLKAASSSTQLTAEAKAVALVNGKRTQEIQLKIPATAPVGQTDETVVLYSDDLAYPELRVPVRIIKKAPGTVSAFPEKANIALAQQNKASSLVQIRSTEGKTVAIAKVECAKAGVTTKWSGDAGAVATLRITIDASLGRTGKADVVVTLKEPLGQTVTIPVTWAD